MTDLAAWDRFAALLTDDPGVAPQVRLAVADPAGYLAAHEDALLQRGIEEADEVEGVVALVDALQGAGEVAYLDWKEEAGEVRAQVAGLPRVRAAGVALDAAGEGSVEQVARAISRLLGPAGLVVVQVDEGSDAYPLVAVPADRLPALVAAGAAVDVGVRTFG